MSQVHLSVDGLNFTFPPGWTVGKFDEWSFYTNQFQKIRSGLKAIDILAWNPTDFTLWLIEVKDYRQHQRTKPLPIHEEVAGKVLDTLAALLPAQVNANLEEEQELAKKATRAREIKIVLHLEQPRTNSKLFPRAFDPADVLQALRSKVKPINPHPLVLDIATTPSRVPWSVT